MKMTNTNHHNKLQTGSTLFICLMLLLAISIISLASMRTSLLELVIANNKQQYSNTFQAAEQAINFRLANLALVIDGTVASGDVVFTENGVAITNSDGTQTAIADTQIIFRSQAPSLGWDLGNGVAYHFQIDATATAAARNAVSQHRNGFYIVAPN